MLSAQAGAVTAVEVIKERKSGDSKGFAFVMMSERSEADTANQYVQCVFIGRSRIEGNYGKTARGTRTDRRDDRAVKVRAVF